MDGRELITEAELKMMKEVCDRIFAMKTSDSAAPIQHIAYHLAEAVDAAKSIRQDYPNGIY